MGIASDIKMFIDWFRTKSLTFPHESKYNQSLERCTCQWSTG